MFTPRIDLGMIQGADFGFTFSVKGSDGNLFDFTGWSGQLQCRGPGDPGSETPLFELSTESGGSCKVAGVAVDGGGIMIAGTSVTLSMPGPTATALLTSPFARYDLFLTSSDGAHARRDFWGNVTLVKGITHHD